MTLSSGDHAIRGLTAESPAGFRMTGDSLRLTETTEPSSVRNFSLLGGRLLFDAGAGLTLVGDASWVGTSIEGPGTTTIAAGSTLTYPGGAGTPIVRNDHVLLNQGTVNWVADEVCVTAGATFDNTATLNITGSGATMTNCAGGAPGGRLRNLAGATIVHTGTGTTTIAVLFENQGTVRVVSGILRVSGSGNYTNPPGATMEFVIGGPTPGTDFGQFQATGTCTLGGTLTVASAPGFTPSPGQSFPVITCGGRTGTFATENSPYPVQYNPTDVTLNAPVGTSAVTLDPPSVAFADQTVGTTSAPRR